MEMFKLTERLREFYGEGTHAYHSAAAGRASLALFRPLRLSTASAAQLEFTVTFQSQLQARNHCGTHSVCWVSEHACGFRVYVKFVCV